MAFNNVETPENFEQKCLCVLVLDVSGSMSGDPIDQLNNGINTFHEEIKTDSTASNRLEVCLIEFSSDVNVLVEPSLVENFTMPRLITKGTTKLVDGVREAIQKVSERKGWYKSTGQRYYRPWIILMTDGAPDSDQDVDSLANEIRTGTANKSFFFFAVGVQGANMDVLTKISSPEMPPSFLKGLKFSEFFKWLSASMTTVTGSKDGDTINMPSPASWMKGFKI
ncbi:vWA domain-containing protein [Mariniradius sediminis]|uniref:VWA domain-containing protein n=1 Tax=Mariniradius sediminis TaxID=2909237 RepID=A0ABS9BUG5_9BACT|nr:VWA domain-containing protein [Mariniradius sediminis]MCF1751364.1 VWA domain-containing protein [Mariniradius sediminis]